MLNFKHFAGNLAKSKTRRLFINRLILIVKENNNNAKNVKRVFNKNLCKHYSDINNPLEKMNSQIIKNFFENKNVKTNIGEITYLNAEDAKKVDELLMGSEYGYSIDQLMEIAGLSVAKAIDDAIRTEKEFSNAKKILCISGPGSMI